MKSRAKRARETRWLYRTESTAFLGNSYANRERSIHFLRRLAARVWRAEAPEGRRLPTITAGRGTPHGDGLASYCIGFTEIVLARSHRNVLVLLHELTHALGPCQHGKAFVLLYFRLLNKYAGYPMDFLQGVAAERNIVL